MNTPLMTYDEFIRSEIHTWDEEYVINLLDAGYDAVLTTAGWKWIHKASPRKIEGRLNTLSGDFSH